MKKQRIPVSIKIESYLLDHSFLGKPVLPAVVAMQVLARSTSQHYPLSYPLILEDVTFDKFLFLKENESVVEAFNEIQVATDGGYQRIKATLITRSPAGKTAMMRTKKHAVVHFNIPMSGSRFEKKRIEEKINLNFQPSSGKSDTGHTESTRHCFQVTPEKLYQDLVPFGPAFQNIRNSLYLSDNNARCQAAGSIELGSSGLLGSPFPLDAAFHAACVWAQRYAGTVAFPVGFEKRIVHTPTKDHASYICHVQPVQILPPLLLFNIQIFHPEGQIMETAQGVEMRDVSGGRLQPPEWVKMKAQ